MVLGVMLGSPLGSSHLPACSPLLGEPRSQPLLSPQRVHPVGLQH